METVIEGQIVEGSGTELARVMSEGDPEYMLAILEKKAASAARYRAAMECILISQTYPGDWTIQGDKACLSSSGAERIGRNFDIQYSDVTSRKEEFKDKHGKGYRYIFSGYATMYGRKLYCEDSYTTREEFLGKAHGEWKPLEEINENDIRTAAHHRFMGSAVKALLGLRGMPATEYHRIMTATGQDAGRSSTVTRGTGTQGGTSADDSAMQKELTEICVGIANAGYAVKKDADGKYWELSENPSDDRMAIDQARDICVNISSFAGRDGSAVAGKPSGQLAGARLKNTLQTARKLREKLERLVGA